MKQSTKALLEFLFWALISAIFCVSLGVMAQNWEWTTWNVVVFLGKLAVFLLSATSASEAWKRI